MSDELITAEDLSRERLRAVLDAAAAPYALDDAGEILVHGECSAYLLPSAEKRKLRLVAQFRFLSATTSAQQLEAVNRINSDFILVRASVAPQQRLRFDYDLSLEGGVTTAALLALVARFCAIPRAAIAEHAADLVE
jgi:Putative bacterial sensory transduction regulator